MRIVQVIDSLETGGAERMAVNYANALALRLDFCGLVATRAEGDLKSSVSEKVKYLFLQRHKTFDFGAAMRLAQFCRSNRVSFIHAHSSSWFISVLAKLFYPQAKIIWHDHYGMSDFIAQRKVGALNIGSRFFSGIISVNATLAEWARKNLKTKAVAWIPNFAPEVVHRATTKLEGSSGMRILCLANLRPQKNQKLLLEAAAHLKISFPEWTVHLVGKDFNDDYSEEIKKAIAVNFNRNVFYYGSRNDTDAIIADCDICVLSSISEGLPVALLEYGIRGKAVVSTAVGDIPAIIKNGENGFLVPSGDAGAFFNALSTLIGDAALRNRFGSALQREVEEKFSERAAIKQYLAFLETI